MPLLRTPQRAGAGKGIGVHRVYHELPGPSILHKGTPENLNGKDREGTAVRGTAKDTGGQLWDSPFPSAPVSPSQAYGTRKSDGYSNFNHSGTSDVGFGG